MRAAIVLAKRVPQQRGLKELVPAEYGLMVLLLQKEFLSNED